MLIAYLIGTSMAAFVVACCALAAKGDPRAQTASAIGTGAFAAFAWVGLIWASVLMLAAQQVDREGPSRWWSPGIGEQFLIACLGVLTLSCAVRAVRRGRYIRGAGFIFSGACLFALWGLLLEAGWSGRGPLAT